MPEMRFWIRWPDGRREECYSPSLVIKDYFEAGQAYELDDFVARSRTALHIASDRVKQRFGFACTLALGQLARIEAGARTYADVFGPRVVVETFEE